MFKRSALALLLVVVGCGDNTLLEAPPAFSSSNITMTVGQDGTLSIDTTATDPEGRELMYTASVPQHGAVTGAAPHYTYTPDTGYVGPDSFVVTVSNGAMSIDIPVNITVEPIPVAVDQVVTTPFYQPVSITLQVTDAANPTLTYTVVTMPTHGTLSGTAPALTYTADADYFYGSDSFTFHASDGIVTSNTATVTVHVTECGAGIVESVEQCD